MAAAWKAAFAVVAVMLKMVTIANAQILIGTGQVFKKKRLDRGMGVAIQPCPVGKMASEQSSVVR